MKPRSGKNKGSRLQKEVAQKFREKLRERLELSDSDLEKSISSTTMGESGTDVKLDLIARQNLGKWAIECKNTEKTQPWQWIEQAENNTSEDEKPVIFFKRNRSNVYVILKMEDFLDLI